MNDPTKMLRRLRQEPPCSSYGDLQALGVTLKMMVKPIASEECTMPAAEWQE